MCGVSQGRSLLYTQDLPEPHTQFEKGDLILPGCFVMTQGRQQASTTSPEYCVKYRLRLCQWLSSLRAIQVASPQG